MHRALRIGAQSQRGHRIVTQRKWGGPERPNPLIILARPARFERTTPAFGGQYSIQLSYGRKRALYSLFKTCVHADIWHMVNNIRNTKTSNAKRNDAGTES